MTIYEILTESKKNLLDFILKPKYENDEEFKQNVKMQIGEGIDVQQLNQRTEYFNSFDYLVFDREAFANDDRHVTQMFKSIISFMQKASPIFIWINIPDNLKNELIEMGVKNLIISETLDEQKEELLECFSEQGMLRYNKNYKLNNEENFEKYHFREDSIYGIEILSTTSDIISKSISLSLCMYLNEVGANVHYLAPLYDDEELNAIARLISAEKQDNYYIKNNIYLTNDLEITPKENINFIIQDIGYIKKDMFEGLKANNIDNDEFDKKLILCDLNELELDNIKYFYDNLGNKTYLANSTRKYINIDILSSIDKEYFIEINKQLKIKKLDKQEGLIDIRTNRNFFNSLIEPNIIKMQF